MEGGTIIAFKYRIKPTGSIICTEKNIFIVINVIESRFSWKLVQRRVMKREVFVSRRH